MTEHPTEAMKKIIGEERFEKIASCCDEVYRLGYDANSNHALQEDFHTVTEATRAGKSPLERLINAISRNAELVANRIQSMDAPHLKRLAGGIYSLSDAINQRTQQTVASTLSNTH